jgi:hypothetical protein
MTAINLVGKGHSQQLKDNMEPRFLTTVGENTPVIMCEKHAQIFEKMMMVNEIPHTIYEMDDSLEEYKCQACHLIYDILDNQPRIILPN